jgi:hypothetical protein
MKVNKIYEDVYEVENFLTTDELAQVKKIINDTPEEKWFDEQVRVDYGIPDFWFGKQLHFIHEKTIFDDINSKMENLLESCSYYPSKLNLSRYKIGDFIQPHTDQWLPDLDYYIGYGFCLYYNDNYDGGELNYPEIGISIKPKENSLYIHGGHVMHGSLPVLNDSIRYFSTVFVHGTEEQPTRLRGDIFK